MLQRSFGIEASQVPLRASMTQVPPGADAPKTSIPTNASAFNISQGKSKASVLLILYPDSF